MGKIALKYAPFSEVALSIVLIELIELLGCSSLASR
jgi:hypothetical protein